MEGDGEGEEITGKRRAASGSNNISGSGGSSGNGKKRVKSEKVIKAKSSADSKAKEREKKAVERREREKVKAELKKQQKQKDLISKTNNNNNSNNNSQAQTQTVTKTKIDVIAQTAKRIEDMFSASTSSTTNNVNTNTNIITPPIFNVSGVDGSMLELREVLKRFRDVAVGTAFSPGKFPSILRPRLNETICTTLRAFRQVAPAEPLPPANLFSALASFLPFSPPALTKLINKKIIGPLKESLTNAEIPKLYEKWSEVLRERIAEFESTVTTTAAVPVPEGVVSSEDVSSAAAVTSIAPAGTSEKKKLKFTDEMRVLIFDITRAEIDLNNLVILILSTPSTASESNDTLGLPKPQSDLSLKKIIYQKLIQSDPGASNIITTTDLSREYGAQKRKHEKRISKLAGDILFGEQEIEQFLTVAKKEVVVAEVGQVQVQVVDTNHPAGGVIQNDPLKNLFDEDVKSTTDNTSVSVQIQSTGADIVGCPSTINTNTTGDIDS